MKKLVLFFLILVLFYTRFVNIGWGMPYPMHPDERNMANAVQGLSCDTLRECLNPHFFAYGQLPLYLAYGGIQAYHLFFGLLGQSTYEETTVALRTISAISSILLVFVLLKMVRLFFPRRGLYDFTTLQLLTLFFFIFSPYAIQLSHFGTTESVLMLFYVLIIYFSLLLFSTLDFRLSTKYIFLLALFSGLSLGTKMSSLLFLGVPIITIIIKTLSFRAISEKSSERSERKKNIASLDFSVTSQMRKFLRNDIYEKIYHVFISLLFYSFITLFFFILSSPHNLLNWNDFISSMTYESRVGLGRFVAFYTRQFVDTTPILFQFQKILPFALGWPTLIVGALGFILLPSSIGQILCNILCWLLVQLKRTQKIRINCLPIRIRRFISDFGEQKIVMESVVLNPYDILRFSLLFALLPPSFFFAKWTRFISPSFPLFSLFAVLFMINLYSKWRKSIFYRYVFYILCGLLVIPGIAQLSIYRSPDVRFAASEWMYKNIPEGSKILTETANAIDLPIVSPDRDNKTPLKNFFINSFYFYDLDQSLELQNSLDKALEEAEYIIVPTRRVFYNHTCLYPDISQTEQQQTDRCKELSKTYPLLNSYYSDLFSGKLGFEKIAEFNSFPKISFMGKTLLEFPDEDAEETWTVFDHPVIRIYKKSQKSKVSKSESQIQKNNLDFNNYKTVNFRLSPLDFRLLIADTPEKWKKGLMYVESKKDIGGLDGMIFTFPDSQPRTFWNKNTLSHLTLYWINKKKVIGVSDLPSITETGTVGTVSSPSEADEVIEIIK